MGKKYFLSPLPKSPFELKNGLAKRLEFSGRLRVVHFRKPDAGEFPRQTSICDEDFDA
jgi:hypothetical protein